MIVKSALLLLFLCAFTTDGGAQYFSDYSPDKELFKHEVKLIEEFIERFNDDSSSYIRQEYTNENKPFNITRSMLIVSLFNHENADFTDKDKPLLGFFHQVMDHDHPVYLCFNDSDWYAEAQGVFLQNGKLVEIPIILHIKSNGDWAKWMIAGIGKAAPGKEVMPSVSAKKINSKNAPKYIATSAYATNFVGLHYVLNENMEPENFFDYQSFSSEKCRQFVGLIKAGKLKFQYVKSIKYHFYQVNGWLFTVEQYNRQTMNSGWLISSMKKVTAAEKAEAKRKLLGW